MSLNSCARRICVITLSLFPLVVFAQTFTPSICSNLSHYDPGSGVCTVKNLQIPDGTNWIVPAGMTLAPQLSAMGIASGGSLTISADAGLVLNTDIILNGGQLIVNGKVLTNGENGAFSVTVNQGGVLTVSGSIAKPAQILITPGSNLAVESGGIVNTNSYSSITTLNASVTTPEIISQITNSGTINNGGVINNYGKIQNNNGGSIHNQEGQTTGITYGRINNFSLFENGVTTPSVPPALALIENDSKSPLGIVAGGIKNYPEGTFNNNVTGMIRIRNGPFDNEGSSPFGLFNSGKIAVGGTLDNEQYYQASVGNNANDGIPDGLIAQCATSASIIGIAGFIATNPPPAWCTSN